MSYILDLPDELASQLTALLPEEERDRFAVDAIASALTTRTQDADARLAASLLADLDPTNEPEREAAECIATVEEELEDLASRRNLVSFEELRRQWEEEKRARQSAGRQ